MERIRCRPFGTTSPRVEMSEESMADRRIPGREGAPSRAVLVAVLAWVLAPAAAREPDALEALRSGDARAGFPPAGRASAGLAVRAAGRDIAPVADDGTFRIEGLPGDRSSRLEVLANGSVLSTSDPLAPPAPLPPPGEASTRDLDGGPPSIPPRRGLDLLAPGGKRWVALGAKGLSASLSASIDGPDGPAALVLPAAGAAVRTTDAAVATVGGSGRATAIGRGLAWAVAEADGEEAAVSLSVDLDLDSDGDGMPDSFEIAFGLDPANPADAALDPDGDGLTSLKEFLSGTDPRNADTDGDGISDSVELLGGKSDPLRPDTDSDGANDGLEIAAGTDPRNPNERPGPAFSPFPRSAASLSGAGISMAGGAGETLFAVSSDRRIAGFQFDPSTFLLIFRGSLQIPGSMSDVAVEGARAYVAAGTTGVEVVDVTNPGSMSLLGTTAGLGVVSGVAVSGGIVYLATDTGLKVLEPAGGDTLRLAGSLTLPSASRVALGVDVAFVADRLSNRLVSVDISDRKAPRLLQSFALPAGSPPLAAIAVSGSMVYVAHGSGGVLAVSARTPGALSVVDTSLPNVGGAVMNALAVRGNTLFAHDSRAGLADKAHLFRIDDDGKIALSGSVKLGSTGSGFLLARQEYLLGLSDDGRVTVSQVLSAGDRGGAPPTGTLDLLGGRSVWVPGDAVTVEARIRDDVYIESVDFLVDGVLRARDTVPPFRFTWTVPPSPVPGELLIEARGRDLAGSTGPSSGVLVRFDGDQDADGLADAIDPDRDGDGIPDVEEWLPGRDGFVSDPGRADTDGDGIPDGVEVTGAPGTVSDPSSADGDGDLLGDSFERSLSGTDPLKADSDGNGIPDGAEDPDGDGLVNAEEQARGTKPRLADSDGDGLSDGLEVRLGLDPLRLDSNSNGVPDGSEDFDGDNLSNAAEVAAGTDPASPDTDGDGIGDGDEVALGTDPRQPTDFSSRDLRFAGRTVVLRGPLRARSLVLSGAVLTVPPPGTGAPVPLDLTLTGSLQVDPASRIDVSGRGHPGGSGAASDPRGEGPASTRLGDEGAGGSNGGAGGGLDDARRAAAPTHGRLDDPRSFGGGGSSTVGGGTGGAGGGAVRIAAGDVVIDGAIDARGMGSGAPGYSPGSGAGAGGSIRLSCRSLAGAGELRADGGTAEAAGALLPGGGGGGRIAVFCAGDIALDRARIHARGGGLKGQSRPLSHGGAGTVLLSAGGARGDLIVENGGLLQDEPRTLLPSVGEGTIAALTDTSLTRAEGPFPDPPFDAAGLWLEPDLDGPGGPPIRIEGQDGATLVTAPGLLARAHPSGRFRGVVLVDRLLVSAGGAVATDDGVRIAAPGPGPGGEVQLLGELHAAELTLEAARDLRLVDAVLSAERVTAAGGALGSLSALRSTIGLDGLACDAASLDASGLLARGAVEAGSLSLAAGSVITVPDPDAAAYHALRLDVAGLLSLDATSAIDIAGKGYLGGRQGGNGSLSGQGGGGAPAGGALAGGSHGGLGGHAGQTAAAGEVPAAYGDFEAPAEPGGGGSASDDPATAGGSGGGLALITADDLLLDGRIDASGAGADRPGFAGPAGAGAGGSVRIDVRVLRGSGVVAADGGPAQRGASTPGGGGGGRIAVTAADRSGFTGRLSARGGGLLPDLDRRESQGGAGTVHVIDLPAEMGDLTADNGGRAAPAGSTPILPGGRSAITLARLRVRGGAEVTSPVPLAVLDPEPGDPGFAVEGSLSAPSLELPSVASIALSLGTFDPGDLRLASPPPAITLTAAEWVVRGPVTCASLRLVSSALRVPDPTSAQTFPLVLAVSGALEIDAASAIRLRGRGYVGGFRGGNADYRGQTAGRALVAGVGERSGGSHGALGGYYDIGSLGTTVPPVYDSYRDPQYPGGGGSGTAAGDPGFNGGGLARITAHDFLLDGRIDASGDGKDPGGPASLGGGGAGGSVLIDTDILRGTGEVSADGGSTHSESLRGAGAGGGGRIAVYRGDGSGFTGRIHAYGGALLPAVSTKTGPVGGAGTVFLKGDDQAWGDLVIDNAGRVQAAHRTVHRAIGQGTIVALTAQTLKGDSTFPAGDTRAVGQWVVVNGAVTRPFQVASNTSAVLTTRVEDGSMTSVGAPGSPYQGAIVLDNLTLQGAALVSTLRQGAGYDLIIIATGAARVLDVSDLDAPPVVHW